jgi:hypothetical protein
MTTPTPHDGTTSSTYKGQPVPSNQLTDGSAPLLTSHAALILLAAAVIGCVVAGLTHLSARNSAAAALAGLVGAGASIPVLHTLIGL